MVDSLDREEVELERAVSNYTIVDHVVTGKMLNDQVDNTNGDE